MDQCSDLAHITDKSGDHGLQKWTVINKRARLLHGSLSCGPKGGDFLDYSSEKQKTNNRKRCRTENSRPCTAITTQPDPNVGSGEITMVALQRRIGPLPAGTTWPRGIGASRAILAIAAVTAHKAATVEIFTVTCTLVHYQSERLLQVLQVLDGIKTSIICVLTALSWASLQISHLPFSERSWLESFPRSPRHF